MSQLRTYDPSQIVVSVAGIPMTMFAADSMVAVEYNTDQVSLEIGAQGDGVRVISRDLSAKITITLQANSPANDQLSALAISDQQVPPIGIGEFLAKQLGGTTILHATNVWVSKWPKTEWGKDPKDRQWTLETDSLQMFAGGTVT